MVGRGSHDALVVGHNGRLRSGRRQGGYLLLGRSVMIGRSGRRRGRGDDLVVGVIGDFREVGIVGRSCRAAHGGHRARALPAKQKNTHTHTKFNSTRRVQTLSSSMHSCDLAHFNSLPYPRSAKNAKTGGNLS